MPFGESMVSVFVTFMSPAPKVSTYVGSFWTVTFLNWAPVA